MLPVDLQVRYGICKQQQNRRFCWSNASDLGDDTSSSWWCFPSEILHRYTLNRELGKVQNLAEIGGAKQRGDRSWREYSCSRIRAAPAINSFQGKITQRIVYRSKFQGIDGFHRLVESRCFKFWRLPKLMWFLITINIYLPCHAGE